MLLRYYDIGMKRIDKTAERQTESWRVMVSASERERGLKRAAAAGMAFSEYARRMVLEGGEPASVLLSKARVRR